jgi:copper chaperone
MGQDVTHTFTVTGMHCASCGMLIDDTLEDLDGVTRTATNLRARRSTVTIDPSRCTPEQVIAAITAAGPYTARWDATP